MQMIRTIAFGAAAALALTTGAAVAAGGDGHIDDVAFSFEGPFGSYDQLQLQRGLKIYTEVCSSCHGLRYVPIRDLAAEGGPALPEDQVRAYAAGLDPVTLPTGDERPREWTDHFPTRSGDGMGPDLSLMAKARAGFHGPLGLGINQFLRGTGGPEYIYSLLTGYTGEEKEEFGAYFHGNHTFPGGWIAMGPPLADGQVDFDDEHANDLHNLAMDVSAFLMWTAEPKLAARKQAGLTAVLFLIVLSVLLYLTNKKLWADVKGKKVTL